MKYQQGDAVMSSEVTAQSPVVDDVQEGPETTPARDYQSISCSSVGEQRLRQR